MRLHGQKITTALALAVVLFLTLKVLGSWLLSLAAKPSLSFSPPVFSLAAKKNFDTVFSLPLPFPAIIIISAVALFGLSFIFFRLRERSKFVFVLGYAATTAGALTNIFERLRQGYVWDYLVVSFFGLRGYWNVADICILAGIFFMLAGSVKINRAPDTHGH